MPDFSISPGTTAPPRERVDPRGPGRRTKTSGWRRTSSSTASCGIAPSTLGPS